MFQHAFGKVCSVYPNSARTRTAILQNQVETKKDDEMDIRATKLGLYREYELSLPVGVLMHSFFWHGKA